MCLMCLAKIVEASIVSFAAVVTGWAFIKAKYISKKAKMWDDNTKCHCGCHCECHKNECNCDCHIHKNHTKK